MNYTNLEAEIRRMLETVTDRLETYNRSSKPSKLTLVDQIVGLLVKASHNSVDEENRFRLRETVVASIDHHAPIPLAFLWAMGGHARSAFKLLDSDVCLPRLGDFWMFFWLSMLNQKIQKFYAPGLEVIIADEVPQLELLGFTPEQIKMRRAPLCAVAREYAPFVRIVELAVPEHVVNAVPDQEPHPDLIFAVATSMEWESEIPSDVYDMHYKMRDKPWGKIQEMLPPGVWSRSADIQRRMMKIGEARKRVAFFDQFFGGRPYIDAAITDKGRWSPDVWNLTFPQHGGTLLDAKNKRFSIKIIPEKRLMTGGAVPTMIAAAEFKHCANLNGCADANFAFYWTEE